MYTHLDPPCQPKSSPSEAAPVDAPDDPALGDAEIGLEEVLATSSA
jgi:hypothetical protein